MAGWARRPSTGLVGIARKDATNAAQAVLQYLQTVPPTREPVEQQQSTLRIHPTLALAPGNMGLGFAGAF